MPGSIPIPSGNMPGLTLKAWVKFNPTNGVISSSSNIASMVRNGVGNYTFTYAVPFITNFPLLDFRHASTSQPSTLWAYISSASTTAPTINTVVGGTNADISSLNYFGFYE